MAHHSVVVSEDKITAIAKCGKCDWTRSYVASKKDSAEQKGWTAVNNHDLCYHHRQEHPEMWESRPA
ncbi:MAG TPA: hypothetical protein VFA74_09240 [Terriglobales bacterium]|nr:hypothetical protein [Terriglobales bacterium]